jgi:uncharacterized protein
MQRRHDPLNDAEIGELDGLLASIHAPLQPMDASAVDGYLCGVLLQPVTISRDDWLPLIFDVDGRPAPHGPAAERIAALAQRRWHELQAAITARQWFDPWIFESDDPEASPVRAQLPWVAGFAAAFERFPGLAQLDSPRMTEPLAVLFAAFDPDDLEDADALHEVIETLEPPGTLAEAAEDLVRSVLLLADVSRPRRPAHTRPRRG